MPEHVITAMNESGFAVDQLEIDNLLNDLNKRKAVNFYLVHAQRTAKIEKMRDVRRPTPRRTRKTLTFRQNFHSSIQT